MTRIGLVLDGVAGKSAPIPLTDFDHVAPSAKRLLATDRVWMVSCRVSFRPRSGDALPPMRGSVAAMSRVTEWIPMEPNGCRAPAENTALTGAGFGRPAVTATIDATPVSRGIEITTRRVSENDATGRLSRATS